MMTKKQTTKRRERKNKTKDKKRIIAAPPVGEAVLLTACVNTHTSIIKGKMW